jgi:hypothetical protein
MTNHSKNKNQENHAFGTGFVTAHESNTPPDLSNFLVEYTRSGRLSSPSASAMQGHIVRARHGPSAAR